MIEEKASVIYEDEDECYIYFAGTERSRRIRNEFLIKYYETLEKHDVTTLFTPAYTKTVLYTRFKNRVWEWGELWRWIAENWEELERTIHHHLIIPKLDAEQKRRLVMNVEEKMEELKRERDGFRNPKWSNYPLWRLHIIGLLRIEYGGRLVERPIILGYDYGYRRSKPSSIYSLDGCPVVSVVERSMVSPVEEVWIYTPLSGYVARFDVEIHSSGRNKCILIDDPRGLEKYPDPIEGLLKRELWPFTPHKLLQPYPDEFDELTL